MSRYGNDTETSQANMSSAQPNESDPPKVSDAPHTPTSIVPQKPPEKWKLIKVFYFIVVVLSLAVVAVGGIFVFKSFGIVGLVVGTVLVALGLAWLGKFVLSD
jgi:hypothetical protein